MNTTPLHSDEFTYARNLLESYLETLEGEIYEDERDDDNDD